MSQNDLILIRHTLSQRKSEIAPERSDDEYLEIFVAEQALKDRDLTYEELEDGIVDGPDDGGVDAIYIFVNGALCREEIDAQDYRRGAPLEVVFIQAKSGGFSESAMNNLHSFSGDFLDLDKQEDDLTTIYNERVVEKMLLFRACYLQLASKMPQLSIHFYYAALSTDIHDKVVRKVTTIENTVKSCFSPVTFRFDFLTPDKLLELARRAPTSTHDLILGETPISTKRGAYVCLVRLSDYYTFVSENGRLNERIFESNVRDYQGDTEVNGKIRSTLQSGSGEDFWWLNNGISILCTKASVSAKTLTMENPEIVNGLQTSREVFRVFSETTGTEDDRCILVRVIEAKDAESRDRIIRATNSQTAIPTASLRATDKIHRDIESYLLRHGIFYDRRKNYYKNQGKPVRNIVSISFVAQAILSCALGEPASARARPSSLIKRDEDYTRVFSSDYPLESYHIATAITRRVIDALRQEDCGVAREHTSNLRFYVAMVAAIRLTRSTRLSAGKLARVEMNSLTDSDLMDISQQVWKLYSRRGASDRAAKGPELTKDIIRFESKGLAKGA